MSAASENPELAQAIQEFIDALNRGRGGVDDYTNEVDRAAASEEKRQAAIKERVAKEKAAFDEAVGKWKKLGDAATNLTKSLNGPESAMQTMGDATAMAVKGLTSLAGGIPVVGAAIKGLGEAAGEAIKFLTAETGKAFAAFGKLSTTGVVTSFQDMRSASEKTGLTFDQLSQTLGKNSEALALFAGSAISGSKKMQDVMEINREAAGELQKLGIGFQEFAEIQAGYIANQAKSGFAQGKSNEQLAAGAREYAEQLAVLSKLTGKNREELQKDRDKAMSDTRFRAKIAELKAKGDETTAKRLLEAYSRVPEGMRQGFSDMVAADGAVTSKAAAEYAVTMGQAGQNATELTQGLIKGTESVDSHMTKMADGAKKYVEQTGGLAKVIGPESIVTKNFVDMANLAQNAGKSFEEIRAGVEKDQKDQLAKKDPTAAVAAQAQKLAQKTGMLVTQTETLMKYNEKMGKVMEGLIETLGKFSKTETAGFMTEATPYALGGLAVAGVAGSAIAARAGKKLLGAGKKGATGAAGTPGAGVVPGVADGAGMLVENLGRGGGGFLEGTAKGLSAFAKPQVALGAVGFGAAIAAIGAGLAGATWLMGKALPTLAEGLAPFEKLDGEKLIATGKGVGALGAGLAVFSAGGIASSFGTVATSVSDGIASFFGGKTPFQKLEEFSKLNIDAAKVKNNAEAFVEFAKVMGMAGIGGVAAGIGTAISAVGDAISSKLFKEKTPLEKFVEFSKLDVGDPKKLKDKAEAFSAFMYGFTAKPGTARPPTQAPEPVVAAPAAPKPAPAPAPAPVASAPAAPKPAPAPAPAPVASAPAAPKPAPAPATSTPVATAAKPPSTGISGMPEDVQKNLAGVKQTLLDKGVKDENYINAILGNIMKETGGRTVEENLDYSKTSNDRIRSIFGKRAAKFTDQELDTIKADPKKMAEAMYGGETTIGRALGNTEAGDAWKYRGRGYIQLTGKSNYAAASKAIYGDDRLVKNPDLLNSPAVANDVVAWFMEKNKSSMQQKLGIGAGPMTKDQANLLATSQIAGVALTPGKGGFLSGEVLSKVDKYSSQVAGIQPGGQKTNGIGAATIAAADALKLINFGSGSGSKQHFDKLDPSVKDRFLALLSDPAWGGKKINVTSAHRSDEEQTALYKKWKDAGGGPGVPTAAGITTPALPESMGGRPTSHGAGAAIDVGKQGLAELEASGLLSKYGFISGNTFRTPDPVHIQDAGFRAARNGAVVEPKTGGTLVQVGEGGQAEAIVPLPDGRSIPVTIKNSGEQMAGMKELFTTMTDKFDTMIELLSRSNKISRDIQMNTL